MVKKRYLLILSVAIISVLFGSLLYNNLVLAGKPTPEPSPVEVINFPLDEEGNLKTTFVQTSEHILVFNETVTAPSDLHNWVYLASFNTTGFKNVYVMAKAHEYVHNANINIAVVSNNFGIQTFMANFDLYTGEEPQPNRGCGVSPNVSVRSPVCDLYMRVYNSGGGFDSLLTIAVYLTK